ncbi:MAG TPA: bifunctional riboflavin kinase/FAD synthetase [Terriglobia bacterium]|nr:bifunctional riboflavin kinase/FAD synthetase [Terriglobia bacterium]
MKVVSQLSDAALQGPCVLAIGNFDGVHLGHQRILAAVVENARKLRFCPAVLTFDPHPLRLLAPEQAPRLISTLDQKLRLIENMGIELVFIARFDAEFAALTPEAFIRKYLVDGLRTRMLCVGSNFIFGHRQTGNVTTLQQWRQEFELVEIPHVTSRGVIVSSTHVRQRIQDGRVSRACRMLGQWFEIEGRIAAGAGRGRNVTVPTLNLEPDNELVPLTGVYITRTAMDGSVAFVDSITNIGTRPTFNGSSETIETFVLDAAVPATTTRMRLQFLKRVRDEKRFDSPELLREQIGRDVQVARRFFRMLQAGANAGIHSN